MQWKENLVQKAWIFWRVELQLNTEIPHFVVWSWFPYYSPLLDGPAHKCVDWRTTCNMVWSFKDVLAIRVWMILSFCCNFAKKNAFINTNFEQIILSWRLLGSIEDLQGISSVPFLFHLHVTLMYSIIALFPDAVDLKWQLKWLIVISSVSILLDLKRDRTRRILLF